MRTARSAFFTSIRDREFWDEFMKPLKWMGASHDDLCSFPRQAMRASGAELMRIQYGGEPTDWKPMSGIGAGVCEIRVHQEKECRVIFLERHDKSDEKSR